MSKTEQKRKSVISKLQFDGKNYLRPTDSLNGYIENEEGNIDWTQPDEELHRHFNALENHLTFREHRRFSSGVVMLKYLIKKS